MLHFFWNWVYTPLPIRTITICNIWGAIIHSAASQSAYDIKYTGVGFMFSVCAVTFYSKAVTVKD